MSTYKCPYCGLTYNPDHVGYGKVPKHTQGPDDTVCPGVGQCPRNADTDRRPLWKTEEHSEREARK